MRHIYLAFLRGINVGGHIVPMAQLRELFEQLGLTNVKTYIQSGNVLFQTTESDREALTAKIEAHLRQALGYEVPVFLRTPEELAHTLDTAPFKDMAPQEDKRYFVMFLSRPLPDDFELPHYSPKKDFIILQTTSLDAYAILDLSVGKPGNPKDYFEKTFKVKTTSRFYHTMLKMQQFVAKNSIG